jgi:undecaprenyl diphosphate synthase
MGLVLTSLQDEIFMKNNVRFRVIGDVARLPKEVQEKLRQTEQETSHNTAMTMVVALSYSSRWEITHAAQLIAEQVKKGEMSISDITEDVLSENMATSFMPDPELLIRTGGEERISNYLLWQIAYSELYFCDTYWPAFNEEDLREAIIDYQGRQRRFGKTEEQVETNK